MAPHPSGRNAGSITWHEAHLLLSLIHVMDASQIRPGPMGIILIATDHENEEHVFGMCVGSLQGGWYMETTIMVCAFWLRFSAHLRIHARGLAYLPHRSQMMEITCWVAVMPEFTYLQFDVVRLSCSLSLSLSLHHLRFT